MGSWSSAVQELETPRLHRRCTEEGLGADVEIGVDRSYYQISEVHLAVGKSHQSAILSGTVTLQGSEVEVTHGL